MRDLTQLSLGTIPSPSPASSRVSPEKAGETRLPPPALTRPRERERSHRADVGAVEVPHVRRTVRHSTRHPQGVIPEHWPRRSLTWTDLQSSHETSTGCWPDRGLSRRGFLVLPRHLQGGRGHDLAPIHDRLPEHPSLRDLQPVVAEVRARLALDPAIRTPNRQALVGGGGSGTDPGTRDPSRTDWMEQTQVARAFPDP
jgi:hypothetical protein